MKVEKCIYCGNDFDPSRGEGDHVLPAALGEFLGDVRFRGQCPSCNNVIGRFEQQLLQSGPEGFYRAIVCPASARLNRRGVGRQRGALGAPGPMHTANMGGRTVLVEPSDENPCDALVVDQIVLRDEQGQDHPLRLYPKMSAEQLRARIERLSVGKVREIGLQCDEPYAAHYLELVKRLFPDLKITEESATEAGRQQIRRRVIFAVKGPYFQALAKIAFHYYLAHSRRGYRGDEPMFKDLRRFIMNGGDAGKFFEHTQGRFRPPFGELPSGEVSCPREWCHLLAADETVGRVVLYMQLFVGPGCLRPPCYITLGKLPSRLVVPDSVWGHVYIYDSHPTDSRYCGRIVPASITRLR